MNHFVSYFHIKSFKSGVYFTPALLTLGSHTSSAQWPHLVNGIGRRKEMFRGLKGPEKF